MRRDYAFALAGGLDETTQPLEIKPGRVVACLNYEALAAGYGRVDGFERYDGRPLPGPTSPFWMLAYDGGSVAIAAGQTVTGATSAATGVVILDAELASGAWDGTAAGRIAIRALTGSFIEDEVLLVAASPVAVVHTSQSLGGSQTGDPYEDAADLAQRNYTRSLILAVPGSGAVRGVWVYNDIVYAVRDNAGATAGVLWMATSGGWVAVALGYTVPFTSGGTVEITEGAVITGATSGATSTVSRVIVQSGTWAAGDAAGYLSMASVTGVFVGENLNIGASVNVATIAGAPVATALPAGGRYLTINHNFYGSPATQRIYGCNGVGPGFEFDGAVLTPIATGASVDKPIRVAAYMNHLFFAMLNGGWQNSATGEPMSWEATLGAFVGSVGSDITDFIRTTAGLLILARRGIFALTGTSSADWVQATITDEAGAIPFTGQRIGPGLYLDNRGLRSISATQEYGNFAMGTITDSVNTTLTLKTALGVRPVASLIMRTKDHYRLFFSDGSGLSFYVGRKNPEPMAFDLGVVPSCVWSGEMSYGRELAYFGAANGFVYALDSGKTFDGAAITGFCKLSYANLGSPTTLKRFHKVELEVVAHPRSQIAIVAEFDYASLEQPEAIIWPVTASGTGGLWNVDYWQTFYWSSPTEDVLAVDIEGQGRNISITVATDAINEGPHVLRGATVFYSGRGHIR